MDEARSYLIDIVGLTNEEIDAICIEGNYTSESLRDYVYDCSQAFKYTPEEIKSNLEEMCPEAFSTIRPRDFTDAGNAKVLARRSKGVMMYCPSLGWLVYDDLKGVWEESEAGAMHKCIEYSDDMLNDAVTEYEIALANNKITERTKDYFKHAERSRSRSSLENMLELSKAYLSVKLDAFDADEDLLNTAAGVINLRTGELIEHSPELLCTKIAPFSPSDQGAEAWESFLDLITQGDADLKQYLQLNIGMCATGNVTQEDIKFCIGSGRNGKSTFFNAVSKVLGDYAGTIDPDILTVNQRNNDPYKAVLRGKRLVVCGELEEGQSLSSKALKQLASTDKLNIKRLYRDPESVIPTHHICLFSNFPPKVGSNDNGTWRRIKVVPFLATMPDGDKEILNYAEELVRTSSGAILKWIIDGAKMFYANECRIKIPEVVKAATEEYRKSEDWLSLFISEKCCIGKSLEVRVGELYDCYKEFARECGDYVRPLKEFNKAMAVAGLKQVTKRGNKKYYTGIALAYDGDDEIPSEFTA